MAELAALLTTDIPEGRSNLADSHTNLERVAEYCEGNYFQSENKRAALEETKNYTTQSLASVAYQINTLAYNFLQLLDLQSTQLAEMESQMNHIAQTVMIHKEKVARREIGVLTANKTTTRQYKIIAPANPEKPIKYVRKPIDYTALDDVGHGVKSTSGGTPRAKRGSSQGSIQSLGPPPAAVAAMNASVGPAPTTKPPTPPQSIRAGAVGSLTKGSREYRTPPAVAPPQVPSHYAPNYPLGHPRRGERAAGYSTLPMPPSAHMHTHTLPHHPSPQMSAAAPGGVPPLSPPPPQVGLVHPMPSHASQMQQQNHPQTPPPPPPPATSMGYNAADHHTSMPPPPSPLTVSMASGGDMLDHAMHHHTLHHHHHHHHHPTAQMHQHHMHQTLPHQPHAQLAHLNMHGQVTGGNATLGHPPGGMHHQQQQVVLGQHGRSIGNPMAHLHHHMPQQPQPGNVSPPLPPPPPPGEGREEEDEDDDDGGFGRVPNVMRGGLSHGIVPAEADLPGWVPKNYIEKVVAIYDYYADKEDELSFQESAVIYVLKKNDDGWWEGVMEGITGLFPGNYVEPCM